MKYLRSLLARIFKKKRYAVPNVGPIIGCLNDNPVRIFVQDRDYKYAHLVIRNSGKEIWRETKLLNENFCNSTIFVLKNVLDSDNVYEYKVNVSNLETNPGWINGKTWRLRTYVDDKRWNVVFGSCRYILKLLGAGLFDSRSDKAFRSMVRLLEEIDLNGAIFVGDQIYADDLNDLKNDVELEQFISRYETAYSTPWLKELSSRVPFINTLDDHEIEDNYPSKVDGKKMLTKVPAALHTYEVFQLSYSHLFNAEGNRITGRPNRYWYHKNEGLVDYFVTDMRTERDEFNENVMSDDQFEELLSWLQIRSGAAYKLIVSPVPLLPRQAPTGSIFDDPNDKWWYSERQSEILLRSMLELNLDVQPVMFSGDIHMSCVSTITNKDTNNQFVSVISSPIFWPYPNGPSKFMTDPEDYFGIDDEYDKSNIKIEISPAITDDNFSLVSFSEKGMNVKFMPRKCSSTEDYLWNKWIPHQSNIRTKRRRTLGGGSPR